MVSSDLTNSYAWDTTIVYIQNFSRDTDYSMQTTLNTKLANTGVNNDEECKINDMASNTREWTTEYATYIRENDAWPVTDRGGEYSIEGYTVSHRGANHTENKNNGISFRTILYM